MNDTKKESPSEYILGAIIVALMLYIIYGNDIKEYFHEPQVRELVPARTPSASVSDLSSTESITTIRIPDAHGLNGAPLFDNVCFIYENRATSVSHMNCVSSP